MRIKRHFGLFSSVRISIAPQKIFSIAIIMMGVYTSYLNCPEEINIQLLNKLIINLHYL